MQDYLLTVQFPLEARDDAEARAKAKFLMEAIAPLLKEPSVKARLQAIFPQAPPRKVSL